MIEIATTNGSGWTVVPSDEVETADDATRLAEEQIPESQLLCVIYRSTRF